MSRQMPLPRGDIVLTETEFDTLCGYAEGLTTEEISKRMYHSTVTVLKFRNSLFRSLGVAKRHPFYQVYSAVLVAWRRGVLATCPVCRRKRSTHSTDAVVREPVKRKPLLRQYQAPDEVKAALTIRRIEVLQLIAQGFENPEIAEALGITVDSVKIHVKHILRAFRARTRTQAVALAFAYELLTAEDVIPKEQSGDLHDQREPDAGGA